MEGLEMAHDGRAARDRARAVDTPEGTVRRVDAATIGAAGMLGLHRATDAGKSHEAAEEAALRLGSQNEENRR